MKKSRNRASRKCVNAWFKFLAIFCVAGITLFTIFEVDSKSIKINTPDIDFFDGSHDEGSAEKILIAASGASLNNSVAVQFETCSSFIVVNESTGEYVFFSNSQDTYDINAMRSFIKKQNIEAVITGTMEINTYQMLSSSRVEVYTGVTGTAEKALKKLKKHELVSFSHYYSDRKNGNFLKIIGNQKSARKVVY